VAQPHQGIRRPSGTHGRRLNGLCGPTHLTGCRDCLPRPVSGAIAPVDRSPRSNDGPQADGPSAARTVDAPAWASVGRGCLAVRVRGCRLWCCFCLRWFVELAGCATWRWGAQVVARGMACSPILQALPGGGSVQAVGVIAACGRGWPAAACWPPCPPSPRNWPSTPQRSIARRGVSGAPYLVRHDRMER
jgi:hypothetical protein